MPADDDNRGAPPAPRHDCAPVIDSFPSSVRSRRPPMPRRLAIVRAAALVLLGSVNAACPAVAQTTSAGAWPDHPIRVVLPFPPGGPSDMVMRLAAEKMQGVLKQVIVIDNKPGAGGNLGSAEVVGSTPAAAAIVLANDSRKWGAVARRIQLGLH